MIRNEKEIMERIRLIRLEKGKYPLIPSNIEFRMSFDDRIAELVWVLNK